MTRWFILPVIPLDKYFWREAIRSAFYRYVIKESEKRCKNDIYGQTNKENDVSI